MTASEYFTNQDEWEAYLKDLLKTNDKALSKAILLIYENQTHEEKCKHESIEHNGIGFNKFDAKEMGDIAIKIKNGTPLTAGELAKSRNKMQKYWKQLMFISLDQIKMRKLQEQKELKRKMAKEEADAAKEHEEKLKEFKNNIEVLRRCSEEGISCDFGICDECPITTGFQMRLAVKC